MSTVRSCDFPAHVGNRVSRFFSEAEEGWTTGPRSRRVRNPVTGRSEMETVEMDICPPCNGYEDETPEPRKAVEGKVIDER